MTDPRGGVSQDETPAAIADARRVSGQPRGRARPRVSRRIIYAAIWLLMGAAAVFFLAPQAGALAESVDVLARANLVWVLAGVALVAARYVVSAIALAAAAGENLPLVPTTMVQLATSFIGRLTPEGVGWLVLNQRFLDASDVME